MLKYNKIISFVFGLVFLLVLQKFATPVPVFRYLVPAFLVFVSAQVLYQYWYLKQTLKYNIWVLLRPVLLLCAAFGIFLASPSSGIRSIFLITCVLMITLFGALLGKEAENILLNETLIVAFGLFFSFFAAYYYSPSYEPVYLVGIFFSTFLMARSFYEFTPKPSSVKILGATAIGFFMSQLFWALNFLPFHFSALSLLLFTFFYFCLILNYYHLFHIFNFKKFKFQLMLILACDVLVLLATPWRIFS